MVRGLRSIRGTTDLRLYLIEQPVSLFELPLKPVCARDLAPDLYLDRRVIGVREDFQEALAGGFRVAEIPVLAEIVHRLPILKIRGKTWQARTKQMDLVREKTPPYSKNTSRQ